MEKQKKMAIKVSKTATAKEEGKSTAIIPTVLSYTYGVKKTPQAYRMFKDLQKDLYVVRDTQEKLPNGGYIPPGADLKQSEILQTVIEKIDATDFKKVLDTQKIFDKAFNKIASFEDTKTFKAWLFG